MDHLLIFLSDSSLSVGASASGVWDSLGHVRFCCFIIFFGSNGLGNIIPIFGIWFQAV